MKPAVTVKRIYEKPLKVDGFRILVDRLWPRGVSVESASIDLWAKELAPSVALRKWFAHDPDFWVDFQKKYRYELKKNKKIDEFIEKCSGKKKVTLLYAAQDETHNHAIVLQEYIKLKFDEV